MNRHSLRSNSTGRFIKRATLSSVVNGRLYEYRGSIVRARTKLNGMRLVSIHNTLFGMVPDTELRPINRERVSEYLTYADNQGR